AIGLMLRRISGRIGGADDWNDHFRIDSRGNVIIMGVVATVLDGILDPFSRCLDAESAQRVAEFRFDPAVQAQVDVLAQRANEGVLSDDERSEYEAFIAAADFIAILKLKAHRQLRLSGC
ncbi:MAG TPA: hypothetical protein VNY05_30760, partial [Candidatus Acidoferrales bacterium]|nr:hypothetical protein [Candidatus Acidoferrales bacterium]